ncbi:hypothetical protein [Metabacillus litoralis]|jgi:hypothetical protein|uniref:hypothetical protein n=1 Tax=Metabacillus litoralis TaxID=152268 RepID=UPI0020424337|nr:hypothetical protein [Metabacillus litoralis]MCM3652612.1 hypothetical protein [Metabacillus litoralis]
MGWTEFQPIRNEYNEQFKSIDEGLLKLLSERKTLTKGKRYFLPYEIMEEWAKKYKLDIPHISWLFYSVNNGSTPFRPDEPGELLTVIPIMKKSVVGDFEYVLTHSMQHKNASLITLEIKQLNEDVEAGHLLPQLILEIISPINYNVNRNGSRGGGGQTQVRFLVSLRLPEDLKGISFWRTFLMPHLWKVLQKE